MATTLTNVAHALQNVFTGAADAASRTSGFVQRQSKLTGNIFVQTLTFGWLDNPQATLEELAQTARGLGVAISPQGLDQRLGPRAAACLLQVLQTALTRVITADPVATPILERFSGGVCLLDSTTLTLPDVFADRWPGCGGTTADDGQAALKLQVRFNLRNGALDGPFLQPGRSPDPKGPIHDLPWPADALRLADLAYFSLEDLQTLATQNVFWLTRFKTGTRLYDAAGQHCTLADLLARQTTDTIDVAVHVGTEQRLPCRLLAQRAPARVVEARQKRLRRKQIAKGRHYADADPWALTEWTVYLTNVPPERLTIAEALVLARCRWQVELLFKLWKSEGRIDESRSAKPWRILCEVYAKLLGMVVQHWLLLVSCWQHPDRSLRKASRTVRSQALALAAVLPYRHLVFRTLARMQQCLSKGCRVQKRGRDPSMFQLLHNFAKAG